MTVSPAPSSKTTSTATELLPGHIGNLTAKENAMLKQLWGRLLKLFEQKGTQIRPKQQEDNASSTTSSKKGGWFSSKKETSEKDLFIGATTEPTLITLPLEKALPLIPGEVLRNTFWNMVATDNPDAVVLRFLRARKWDLVAAYDMLTNALRWRIVYRLDDLTALGENGLRDELNRLKPGMGDCFVSQLNAGKTFLGGPDKEGRGICFINVSYHHKEDQPAEVIKLLTMYIMETSRAIVHQPVDTACIVFNMDGFTLKNMDFDFVKFLVSCFEAYYPETLGCLCIHKAPWVFSTVWTLIQPLLDPVVATKIHFTKDLKELTHYVDIPSLPGNITGEKDKKTLDEAVDIDPVAPGTLKKPDTAAFNDYQEMIKEHQIETADWIKTKSVDGDNFNMRRALATQYRLARIRAELDIRGPTRYQAKGMIQFTPEGRVILDFGSDGWQPLDITEMV
ncbi:CRAL-TRIO domain-containing protein [Mycotypha africana]|uniref:CRAL-TRIO domain-containing protein n=1 Tax=Mycotypha africana TaxID=64632 RepID=UPI0023012F2E|nr:CRAL-TRIO domain-containing protein [Mycotypha africana]KAI8987846.1 CRAL-TRIO domain-containing protein [Mycotypha africana]